MVRGVRLRFLFRESDQCLDLHVLCGVHGAHGATKAPKKKRAQR